MTRGPQGRPGESSSQATTPHVRGGTLPSMRTWTAQAITEARPEDVLAALTDPDACARWSPVDFDVEDDEVRRLRAGTRTRVSGKLAGVRVGFDVEVQHADEGRFHLRA